MENLSVVFEIAMILAFGVSWPFNIIRAYKSRTAKGTSLAFLLLILSGYAAGIVSKLLAFGVEGAAYWTALRVTAFCFYIINFVMLSTAVAVYFRNKRLDGSVSEKKA